MTDYYGSIHGVEVTQEEFIKHTKPPTVGSSASKSGKQFRFSKLLHVRAKKVKTAPVSDFCDSSVCSDAAAASVVSIANITVASNDTIKHSNRHRTSSSARTSINKGQPKRLETIPSGGGEKKKKGWRKFLKARKDDGRERSMSPLRRPRAKSTSNLGNSEGINANRQRVMSEDSATTSQKRVLDEAIRGRLDGLDVLSLGPARLASIPRHSSSHRDAELEKFISAVSPKLTPFAIAMDMIWTSAGRDPAEIVLEGFIPNGKDRWFVKMDKAAAESRAKEIDSSGHYSPLPSLAPTEDELDCMSLVSCGNDGSANVDLGDLLSNMWGSDTTPPEHNHRDSSSAGSSDDDEDVLQMAAACSVPIDIDEEAFIIDTASHLEAVHNIARSPLKVSIVMSE